MTDKHGWQPIATAPRDGTPILVWFCGKPHVASFKTIWHQSNLQWCVDNPLGQTGSRQTLCFKFRSH